jgi:uncharacterized repeat protein (TIGR02543 family)
MSPRLVSLLLLLTSIPALCRIAFEPNKGQTDPRVRFLARTSAGVVFVTREAILLHREKAVSIAFENANPQADWQPIDPTGHKIHYMVGRDASRHLHGLDSYGKLTRKDLYPGIDLVLYGNESNQLEYDLIVAPGAVPSRIRIKARSARIDRKTGDLVLQDTTRQRKPVILQGNKTIAGRFKQIGPSTFGFEIAAYDRSKPLIIDPVIESREYLGGIGDDVITSIGPRNSVAGTTTSIDFPGAPPALRHGKDVFYRFDNVTYIMGGSGDETAANCDLSSISFAPVIAGTTNSTDLPTRTRTSNVAAAQMEFGGGATDGFLWDPYGGVTYFGAGGEDRITAITTSSSSFAFTGSTNSGADFPLAAPQLRQNAGGFDAFLASGSWTTFNQPTAWGLSIVRTFGGSGDDHGLAVLADAFNGSYVVAGETTSPNFPLLNPIQNARRGPSDAFVQRFTLNELSVSTLLGGSGSDRIQALSWFPTKSIIAAGSTNSADPNYGGGDSDGFHAVFPADLSRLNRFTYFGGSGSDEAFAIAVDTIGDISIAGRTTSRNLPQRNPAQNGFAGGTTDAFFAQYDSTGALRQATYFGGSGNDEILALGDPQPGFVSAAGVTTSIDLPGTGPGIFDPRRFGTAEGFLVRFSTGTIAAPPSVTSARDSRLTVPIGLIDRSNPKSSGRVTLRSSDSSRVRATFYRTAPAFGEDAQEWYSSSAAVMPLEVYVECVADTGEATLTLSSAGLGDASMLVRCVQPTLRPDVLSFSVPMLRSDLRISVPVEATDPVTGEVFTLTDAITPGVSPRRVTIESSVPQVAVPGDAVTGQPLDFTRPGDPFLPIPISPGTTIFTATAPGYRSIPSAPLTVTQASGPPRIVEVPRGSTKTDRVFSFNLGQSTSTVIRSLDPTRVLVASGGSTPAAQTTVTSNREYAIVTLPGASVGSEIGIEMSTNGAAPAVMRTVRVTDSKIQVRELQRGELPVPPIVDLSVGETRTFALSPQYDGVTPTFESSNPTAVPTPASGYTLALTGLSEGSSTVSIRLPAGFGFHSTTRHPIQVRVRRPSFTLADFPLANGLFETQTISLPIATNENVTISTSTPERIQLERLAGVGTASSIVEPGNGRRLIPFRIHGKASTGEASFTVSIPGYAPVTTKARLYPAGFFWTAEQMRLAADATSAPSLAVGPVDPVTGLPFAIQTPSDPSGAPVPVINNSNPSAAVFVSPASVRGVTPGQSTTLTIRQPPGFGASVIRQSLRVDVPAQAPPPPTQALLRIAINSGGRGSVGGTYNCSSSPCFASPTIGAQIQLTAAPAPGFVFAGWSGDVCAGTAPACSFTATAKSMDVTASFAAGLHFRPLAPCRVVDTRNPNGPLGGPALNGARNFPIRGGTCGIPSNALAYSLNITVVPRGQLGYISIWRRIPARRLHAQFARRTHQGQRRHRPRGCHGRIHQRVRHQPHGRHHRCQWRLCSARF